MKYAGLGNAILKTANDVRPPAKAIRIVAGGWWADQLKKILREISDWHRGEIFAQAMRLELRGFKDDAVELRDYANFYHKIQIREADSAIGDCWFQLFDLDVRITELDEWGRIMIETDTRHFIPVDFSEATP